MSHMISVPPDQCHVACIFEKDFPPKQFDMAIAEQHVGFGLMA
jgi:deoxyxylulose-5-phosphate synthase